MTLNLGKIWTECTAYNKAFFAAVPKQDGSKDPFAGYTNRFVEGTRASPYWAGHVDQIVYPLCALLVLIEIGRALL